MLYRALGGEHSVGRCRGNWTRRLRNANDGNRAKDDQAEADSNSFVQYQTYG
jgi:hypothetical protein